MLVSFFFFCSHVVHIHHSCVIVARSGLSDFAFSRFLHSVDVVCCFSISSLYLPGHVSRYALMYHLRFVLLSPEVVCSQVDHASLMRCGL